MTIKKCIPKDKVIWIEAGVRRFFVFGVWLEENVCLPSAVRKRPEKEEKRRKARGGEVLRSEIFVMILCVCVEKQPVQAPDVVLLLLLCHYKALVLKYTL